MKTITTWTGTKKQFEFINYNVVENNIFISRTDATKRKESPYKLNEMERKMLIALFGESIRNQLE